MFFLPSIRAPRRLARMLSAALLALTVALLAPSVARAADTGGDGSPSASCANGYTVKSAPIYGARGRTQGQIVGQLELRWSWACQGNWARVVLYGGLYSDPVTVRAEVSSEGRSAVSEDTVRTGRSGTTTWTRFVRLANSQSRACVVGTMSSDFGTLNFHSVGASFCA